MGINNVTLSGRLTKDPELRQTNTGKSVANFSLAIQETEDHTEFINCVAWDKTGEVIAQYCQKGNKLAVQGKIQTRKWQDQDGNTKYATEVIVFKCDLPEKQSGGFQDEAPAKQQAPQDDMSDEVPF